MRDGHCKVQEAPSDPLITVALHLSGLIGGGKPSGYAGNPDNWIFL